MPPDRIIAPLYTLPGNSKGKAPEIDLDQHDGESSPTDRSRDQSAIFVTPTPQATSPTRPRRRVAEVMADLKEAKTTKKARIAASTPGQSAGPPRPSIEEFEDQDEEQTDRPEHHGHPVMSRQPGGQTHFTSNAAGNETDVDPSRIVTDPPQGSRNSQGDKIQSLMRTSGRTGSDIAAGESSPRATPSAEPANTTVDLTGSDDENVENNGVPPGHSITPRTGIKAPNSKFRKAIRSLCSMKCEAAASTLSRRTDEEGKHIFHRCVGTAALLKSAKNLSIVRTLMANDVRYVLADANATLSRRRDKYNRYFESEDDSLQKLELKRILDRQDARVEKVEQTQNWRRDLVNDLREMSPTFLRLNI